MSIIDIGEIKRKLGIEPNGRIQKLFQVTCYKAMDRFVPMSNLQSAGNLRTIVDLSNPLKIVYESPYAHAQYIGFTKGPVKKYTTIGTGPYWDLKMWTSKKDEILRTIAREMFRGGK